MKRGLPDALEASLCRSPEDSAALGTTLAEVQNALVRAKIEFAAECVEPERFVTAIKLPFVQEIYSMEEPIRVRLLEEATELYNLCRWELVSISSEPRTEMLLRRWCERNRPFVWFWRFRADHGAVFKGGESTFETRGSLRSEVRIESW